MSSIAAIEECKEEFTDADLDAYVLYLLSCGALVQANVARLVRQPVLLLILCTKQYCSKFVAIS